MVNVILIAVEPLCHNPEVAFAAGSIRLERVSWPSKIDS
jgi:hypothetical protein